MVAKRAGHKLGVGSEGEDGDVALTTGPLDREMVRPGCWRAGLHLGIENRPKKEGAGPRERRLGPRKIQKKKGFLNLGKGLNKTMLKLIANKLQNFPNNSRKYSGMEGPK